MADTHSRGIATAALPSSGHVIVAFFGMVVVVVVVDVVGFVVVVTGIVVVVGAVLVEQVVGMVVVVASAGASWADVAVSLVETTSVLSPSERSAQRRNQWCVRGVT